MIRRATGIKKGGSSPSPSDGVDEGFELQSFPAGKRGSAAVNVSRSSIFIADEKLQQRDRDQRSKGNNSDNVLSLLTLSQWVISYASRSRITKYVKFSDPHDKMENSTENGNMAIEVMTKDDEIYDQTGCYVKDIYCTLNHKSTTTGAKSAEGVTVTATFLNDWYRLWEFLENDKEDEIGKYIPFFRAAVEFFFHERTYQFLVFLFLYEVFTSFLINSFYPLIGGYVAVTLFVFADFIKLLAYVFVFKLFKGRLPYLIKPRRPTESNMRKHIGRRLPDPTEYQSLNWTTAFRELVVKSLREVPQLFREIRYRDLLEEEEREKNIKVDHEWQRDKSLSFFDLMNISMKFLVRHNNLTSSAIPMSPKRMHAHKSSQREPINDIDQEELSKWNSKRYRWTLFITLTVYVLSCISLEAQTYISWFGTCYDEHYQPRHDISHYDIGKCHNARLRFILTFGLLTDFLLVVLSGGGILTGLIGLAYGGEIANRLTTGWMEKYCCLRRVTLVNDDISSEQQDHCHIVGQTSKNSNSNNSADSEDNSEVNDHDETEEKQKISELMIHDATEHYLFIQEVANIAGRIWSPVIAGFVLFASFLVVEYILYALNIIKNVHSTVFIRVLVYCSGRFAILVGYPIVSIAHANTYIYKLKAVFKACSANDFEVIGYRDRWLMLLDECPAVWTFFGIWVTWDRVFGIIWTGAVGMAAYVMTYIQDLEEGS